MNQVTSFFTNRVKNIALSNWRLYTFKQEWLSIILLVLCVKIATSIVSVFSGYYYLKNVFFGLFGTESAARCISVTALIMIELLNALFLAKFFKFALRLNNLKWIFPLCLSIALFSLSFVISCNGIAIYTADNVDITQNIENKYLSQTDGVKADFAARIAVINEHIVSIKSNPTEWRDGKRCVLSVAQLAEMQKCYDEITDLTKQRDKELQRLQVEKRVELAENNENKLSESDKFYKYVAVIMLIQLICSGALWYFWAKISAEDDPETNQKECVEKGLKQIESTVDDCIDARVNTRLNNLKTIYNEIATENAPRIAAKKAAPDTETPPAPKPRIVGFDTLRKTPETPQKNNADNVNTCGVSPTYKTLQNPLNDVKICVECGNVLTPSQVARNAKFCCPSCRVKHYNKTHPEKRLTLTDNALKH